MYHRLGGRLICKDCQAVYHSDNFLSKDGKHCDDCGGVLVRRIDDRPDRLSKKLEQYRKFVKPIINHYSELGLVSVIDATRNYMDMFYDVIRSHKKFLTRAV